MATRKSPTTKRTKRAATRRKQDAKPGEEKQPKKKVTKKVTSKATRKTAKKKRVEKPEKKPATKKISRRKIAAKKPAREVSPPAEPEAEVAPEPVMETETEAVAEYEAVFVKKAPAMPGEPGLPAADLATMGELPMPELVDLMRRYGVTAHEGMDRSKVLVQFMRQSDQPQEIEIQQDSL